MRTPLAAPLLALLALSSSAPAAAAEKPKPRLVLVEAAGSDEELSAFLARLESDLADAGKVSWSDARLSGATLGSLLADPGSDAAKAFRGEWPGGTWVAVSLGACRIDVRRMSYSDTTPEGYRVTRVVENVNVECPASLRLVDAETAKEGKPLEVTGTASFRRNEGEEGESSELEATREAARKAAKKLPGLVRK
jgi:hypothetical protein